MRIGGIRRRRWLRALIGLVFAVSVVAPHAHAHAHELFSPPVDPPRVVRGFEPPDLPYGPGHRGVDFAAVDGTPIRAAASGVVTFAGVIAGITWVSIAHRDTYMTSYGPLTELTIAAGDEVARGQILGRLAPDGHGANRSDMGLHFSLRHAGKYRDPIELMAITASAVTLVGDALWDAGGAPARAAADWGGNRLGGLIVERSRRAQAPIAFHAPSANHLLIIGGLATTSESVVIDPSLLGYHPDSVTQFSYDSDAATYSAADTWDGPLEYVDALVETLRAIRLAQPGRAVDIVAHSQGAVILLESVLAYLDVYDTTLPPIGNIVLLAAPIHGSDVAAAGVLVRDEIGLGPPIVAAQRLTRLGMNTLPLDVPAISALDTRDPSRRTFRARWASAWERALGDTPQGPLTFRPNVVSIAGSRDMVVAAERTRITAGVPDDAHPYLHERVLPGGHGSVKQTEAAAQVVYAALSGEPLPRADGYLARGLSRAISGVVGIARFIVNDVLLPRNHRPTG